MRQAASPSSRSPSCGRRSSSRSCSWPSTASATTIPLPIVDQAKMAKKMASRLRAALGQVLGFVSHVLRRQPQPAHASSAWASCRTSRRRSSSSCSPAVYPPLEKLQKEGESGRKKINEIHPLPHRAHLPDPGVHLRAASSCGPSAGGMGLAARATPSGFNLLLVRVRRRPHHDRRHRLPDVARRADRRVRHRQRHQPDHHGRHRRPHPGRDRRAALRQHDRQVQGRRSSPSAAATGGTSASRSCSC